MSEWDFVTRYKELIPEITDTPDDFIEASALFLISTFAGRKFVMQTAPEIQIFGDSIGGKLLNLWFILIGKTRVARKSTIISKAEEYIEEIAPEILLPKEFTPESLVSNLADKTVNGVTHAAWIHDEISQFFIALKKKDYMASTDAVLSRIYDGRDYHRSTVTRGQEVIKRPYLTALLASTDVLPTFFDELYIRQGFMNRFLYVVVDKGKLKPLKFLNLAEYEDITKELRELGNWLKELYLATNVYILQPTEEAQKLYHEFESWVDDKIMSGTLGIKEGFYGNLPNALLKLAGVYHISSMEADKFKAPVPFLTIDEYDIERAAKFLSKCEKWFDRVVRLMKTTARRKEVIIEEGDIEYIKSIIEEAGGEISMKELVKKSMMTVDKVEKLINTLVAGGVVKWTKIKKGRGRPAIGVKLVGEQES